jgi:hypothetical protein
MLVIQELKKGLVVDATNYCKASVILIKANLILYYNWLLEELENSIFFYAYLLDFSRIISAYNRKAAAIFSCSARGIPISIAIFFHG